MKKQKLVEFLKLVLNTKQAFNAIPISVCEKASNINVLIDTFNALGKTFLENLLTVKVQY